MRKKIQLFGFVLAALVAAELFLRLYYGFCDTVLMKEDPQYEYIAQPNQDRFRFRNHIRYNSMGMRSGEVDTSAIIILGLGDSIINGGVLTDDDSLATTILSDSLSQQRGKKVQFLNVSAGSWGPDNCFAYVKKHGDFGAKEIFLFVSSHDAYDNMSFDKTVGVNVNFPNKQYTFALYELWDRYLRYRLPPFFHKSAPPAPQENLGISKQSETTRFNPGFDSLFAYSRRRNVPLTLYLHAEKSELNAGVYNAQGQEILRVAQANAIPVIEDLRNGLTLADFRDDIHINAKGQKRLASSVLGLLSRSFAAPALKADPGSGL